VEARILMEAMAFAFEYFYHLDMANAVIHCAEVKFSPITMELAKLLSGSGEFISMNNSVQIDVDHVMSHEGLYDLDPGR
jgi:hypothetical protein